MKCILVLMFLLIASHLIAHPMGNFSINHYASISYTPSCARITYIIDMAEIPTFQEMPALDVNHDNQISQTEAAGFAAAKAQEFRKNLFLSLNGKRAELRVIDSKLKVVPGAGGLPTLVTRTRYTSDWTTTGLNTVSYRDQNFPERLGWKEIVIAQSDLPLINANGSFVDRSKQLTEYPQDPAVGAPQEIEAEFQFKPRQSNALISPVEPILSENSVRARSRDDRFTRLIRTDQLSGGLIFLSLLIAFGLGALHALSPGHGKTIVAGYLVGSRGTAYHAVFLGAVVTLTHTIGVFALGLITLYGSQYVLPEKLYPWLSFFSGVSIVLIGASLFRKRLHALHHKHHPHHDPGQHHHHDHEHHHGHEHSHLPVDDKGAITWKSLLTVGITGGALPCPSALVVLLSAISLNRVGFGLLLIVAFSLGLAVVLTSIGLLLVYASMVTRRLPKSNFILQRMPLASSVIIAAIGLAIALRAFLQR